MAYLAKVTIPYFTALPEDVIVNTWWFHFLTGTPGEGDFANLRDNLGVFYSTVYSDVGGVRWAPWVTPSGNTIGVYNITGAPPHPPLYEGSMTITGATPPSTSATTPETAICMSFHGEPESGVAPARKRGRIFLGGMGAGIQAGSGVTFPSVANGVRDLICDAAEAFAAATFSDGWPWIVHSSTVAGDSPVVGGWVDDEPDTQRRRGRDPAIRNTWGS